MIYKGKNLWNTWLNGPATTRYQVSSNGWMEVATFIDWFEMVFLEHTKSIEGPKLLIFDGHVSHMSLEVVKMAIDNNVSIVCLPPHSTHILQPLDVAVFGPMKRAWASILEKYNEKSYNIDKELFPRLLKHLTESKTAFLRRHAVAGFETCGIYPFSPEAISDEKLKVCQYL